MNGLDKSIADKIQFWSKPDTVSYWVIDVVSDHTQHASQARALQEFWKTLSDDKEPNKLYLMQKLLVILTFPEQGNIVRNGSALQNAIQALDPALCSHIKLNLIQAFPQVREAHTLQMQLSVKTASFKEYWGHVFDLITLMVLLDASLQSSYLFSKTESSQEVAQRGSLISYARMLRSISDYFYGLGVANNHDVMDDVALISSLLRSNDSDNTLYARFVMDIDAIEACPEQRMRLVFLAIQHAYSKMGDYFEEYHVLGDGYRMSQELRQAIQDHQQVVKSKLIIMQGSSASSITDSLKTFWYRWGAPADRVKQLQDEHDFLGKLLFVNQQGCLNLKILVQIQNVYPNIFLLCHQKTKELYASVKDDLSEKLMQRAKVASASPKLTMRPDHPLMKSLQQQSKARLIQAPPLHKQTPPSSPFLSSARASISDEAEEDDSTTLYLPVKDIEQLYGTPPEQRALHQHSRDCGNAQKNYLIDWMSINLSRGTLQLNKLEQETRDLCCVYWKYNTKDHFKTHSNVYATEQQVIEYAKGELALLAGSEGDAQALIARQRHDNLTSSYKH
ncbi:MAG: hypothetical protein WC748_10060 [Legionellales bacterium]|jgi:hypothetical protein